jgi:hypothetical protein
MKRPWPRSWSVRGSSTTATCALTTSQMKKVLLHHSVVEQTAFEICVALVNQRRLHPFRFSGAQSCCGKLVAVFGVAIADRDNLIHKFGSRNLDHAFATFANGLETTPARRHDVRATLVTGGYEHNRAGFEMLPDSGQLKALLLKAHRRAPIGATCWDRGREDRRSRAAPVLCDCLRRTLRVALALPVLDIPRLIIAFDQKLIRREDFGIDPRPFLGIGAVPGLL